ncbi:serine--tRNA ligase, mitochondrial isoform X2 [Harmonia axyridis]|nr:serine--tRNA ligase, mitochondrial isoform X2 [Harmonia axyridis]
MKNSIDGNSTIVKLIGEKKVFNNKPLEFQEIAKRMNLVRTDQLGNYSGSKSYYLLGAMASLERALVQYAMKTLMANNFELISVPDLIPRELVEKCGLLTSGVRNQVFVLDEKLHQNNICLSGTSEMSLAGLYMNHIFEEAELPIKLAAVSRCYRSETSNLAEERGLYRVHEFTKVEMFLIVTPEQSDSMLEYIRNIQEDHFSLLDLHMQVLDMPPDELGAPAYRKYDIEAWLPGREYYGEISSCSNCTDYQSRRLGIQYRNKNGELKFVHTLNGTASAIPRLLIALIETGQKEKGVVELPKVLHKYMHGQEIIKKQTKIPTLKLIKSKQ